MFLEAVFPVSLPWSMVMSVFVKCVGFSSFCALYKHVQYSTICRVCTTEKGRVKEGEFICPLSWTVHCSLAGDGYIEATVLLFPSKIFRHGKKKNSFVCYGIFSA
jgi:hypothetical protein